LLTEPQPQDLFDFPHGKATAVGFSWPLPDELDDHHLEELLFPASVGRPSQTTRCLRDFAEVRQQLPAHKHLTLQLVWEEYRETQPDGYGYSRFCQLYQRWSRNQDVVLHQEHHGGEKLFADWAGDTIPLFDASLT
jgi:transposase